MNFHLNLVVMSFTLEYNDRLVLRPSTITVLPGPPVEPLTEGSLGRSWTHPRGTGAPESWSMNCHTSIDNPVDLASRYPEMAAIGLMSEHLAPAGEVSGGGEGAQTVGLEPGNLSRGRDGDGGAEEGGEVRHRGHLQEGVITPGTIIIV